MTASLAVCPSHLSMVPWLTGEGMGSGVIADVSSIGTGGGGGLLIFLNKEVMATNPLFFD